MRSIPNMMRPTSNQISSNEKENVEKRIMRYLYGVYQQQKTVTIAYRDSVNIFSDILVD
jgi:hypothetical protein